MTLLLLFATGIFAGTVDAIAGGGGLISLPMLLGMGIPPHLALGTNKLQGSIGTLVAARHYYQSGLVSFRQAFRGIACGLAGSITGAVLAQVISGNILHHIVPALLAAVLLYTLLSPRLGLTDHAPRLSEPLFYLLFGAALGFYDGFFGPGVGSFWVFVLTYFLGYNLMKATAYTKIFNLNSSLVAMVCFMIGGNIDYHIALTMAAGQIIGGRVGAGLAVKNGAYLIRPVFLTVVTATIVTLLYRNYGESQMLAHFLHENTILLCLSLFILIVYLRMLRHNRLSKGTHSDYINQEGRVEK